MACAATTASQQPPYLGFSSHSTAGLDNNHGVLLSMCRWLVQQMPLLPLACAATLAFLARAPLASATWGGPKGQEAGGRGVGGGGGRGGKAGMVEADQQEEARVPKQGGWRRGGRTGRPQAGKRGQRLAMRSGA